MENDFIGLLVEETHSLSVGLLAILKSGNCIVPISPGFPVERIEFIVEDCRVKVVLTDKTNYALALRVARGSSCLARVICIDDIEFKGREKLGRSTAGTTKEDMDKPCYAIYTSGSTGKPKGVPITYSNLIPLFMWFHNYFRLGGHIRVLQNLSYTFDFGLFELLTTLLAGGALYFFNKKALKDLNEYVDFIYLHQLNCIHTTPSFINNITGVGRKLSPLKLVHLGGEQLNRKLVEETAKLVGENCYLYNGYGPTETTINSSIFSLKVGTGGLIDIPDNIPIGEPSANNIIYILDGGGNFQPIGVTGELYIGGSGVAPGYLNNPELTAEKFYRSYRSYRTYILYKTGDLGRWLPNGSIEFFGRIDHQVKVRGFRIELGEIENRLLDHKEIKECAVTVREGENRNKYLCAYLVVRSFVDPGALRQYLAKYLPDYMTPSYFVTVDKMPLTTSGKIDLRALPEPRLEAGAGYTAPRDEVEEKLAGLWAEVLGVEKDKISIDANFFELGGHSLKATLLAAKIHKEFQVKASLAEIFKTPFIRGLAVTIKEAAREKYISLEPAEKKDYYALTPAQKRLYVLQQMDEQGSGIAYNIPSLWLLEGVVDKSRFQDVFRKLTRRHESLRTFFRMVNEEPVQRVQDEVNFEIEVLGRSPFIRSFDLSRAPLFRVGLIKEQDNKHRLMLDMHHIISDGISMEIFVKDFMMLYEGEDLPPLRFRYKDYSQWQNSLVRSNVRKAQEDYWIEEMAGEIPVLELPFDYPRPAVKKSEGDRLQFDIDRELTDRVKQLTPKTGATPFMVFLAVFNLLLSKLSNQEDIIVGSPIAGRFHHDLENIIGIFINTLAFRNYPCAEKRFGEFLEEVKENCLWAFENQYYQYEELVEKVQVNRDLSRNPLFDVMLVLQTMDRSKVEIPGLNLTPIDHHMHVSKFDIILTAVEEAGRFNFFITYSTALFKQETIYRFIGYFKRILGAVLTERGLEISGIDILSEQEREQLLYGFNDTAREYPTEKTIHQLFAQQVERSPDRIALFVGGVRQVSLTYRQLNKQSDGLARGLIEKGVLADDIVGIMMERSVEMIIGIMGILKAGGAYMPIDPEYPQERIDYILKDSGAKLLVNGDNLANLPSYPLTFLPSYLQDSSNLAYIIYTSGSTGQPKGVMVEHRNAVNVVCWFAVSYRLRWGSQVLQMSDYTFDPSVNQVFGTLLHGGVLHIIDKESLYNTEALRHYIDKHHIQVLNFVPLMLDELLGCGPRSASVEVVLSGGEKLDEAVKQRILENGYTLYNQYGPTETTIDALVSKCSGEKVTLGKPIFNVQCFVFDKNNNLAPIGVAGELCIAGAGVARGYLNRPELTAEKFTKFNRSYGSYRTYIFYKTGDLARRLSGGDIEFLGRIDRQVKIRGYRIEPEEIENRLSVLEGIKEAVVIMRQDESMDKHLCAYITAESGVNPAELRDRLALSLPAHMMPSHIVVLDKIPLTLNGKLDRKLLPAPETGTAGYIAPRGPLEETLAKLWQELLGIERIGSEDNFFQWGGQSLKALRLANKISRALNTRVDLTDVFRYPTIRSLAAHIERSTGHRYVPIEPVEEKEYYPLSSVQKRLYLLYQSDMSGTVYNIPAVFILTGELKKEKLAGIFKQLILRHESFRTSFTRVKGESVQRVHRHVDFEIEYKNSSTDYTDHTGEKDNNRLHYSSFMNTPNHFIRAFDLSKAPLLRVGLIETGETGYFLAIDMHHIISDGVSIGILIKEFTELYKGASLPELHLQYKDFSYWQNHLVESGKMKTLEVFWLSQLAGEIPVLNLPADFPRPPLQRFSGSRVYFEAGPGETSDLKQLAIDTDSTLYIVLFALFNVFLAKLSGQDDIVAGTASAGRSRAELENIIGMFVNTLVLRADTSGWKKFPEFLTEVKENFLAAFENQDYQYENLVEKRVTYRDLSRNPLFDALFVLQNMDIPPIQLPGLKLRPFPYDAGGSKFDISLIAGEDQERLSFQLEFSSDLFKETTIHRFINYFKRIISTVLENPGIRLSKIEIISEEEKKQVLLDFNNTGQEYPKDRTIHELFEQQVEKSPDNIAVIASGGEYRGHSAITYLELNKKSNRLARSLRERGLKPNTAVGVMIGWSADVPAVVLAVLKAGCAYLPIDPEYTENRIISMLKDSNAAVICAGSSRALGREIPVILWDEPAGELAKKPAENLEPACGPGDLIYIIFTSGSTGSPKGVGVYHRGFMNLLHWFVTEFDLGPKDRNLLLTSLSFDLTQKNLYASIITGGTLCIPPFNYFEPRCLLREIHNNRVTWINCTPSMFYKIVEYETTALEKQLAALRYVFLGGEPISMPVLIDWLESKECRAELVNTYGPTECTDISNFYRVKNPRGFLQQAIPIGGPVNNVQLFVVDKNLQPVPVGIAGELLIGGASIGMGYLNDKELTARKFIKHAFIPGGPERLLYCTGDMVKWLPDPAAQGDYIIEYLGRRDHQVKIRGFRIEPGEIESRLAIHPKVKEVFVMARGDEWGADKYLCAYIVPAAPHTVKTLEVFELREYLAAILPDYMIPAYFVMLKTMPLNPNGKVDRRALPEPDRNAGSDYAPPRNERENILAAIWAEILGLNRGQIGIYDNFFRLGGHSLKVAELAWRIRKAFSVEIPIVELFKTPTIKGIFAYVEKNSESILSSPQPVEEKEYYPLSSAQKRLYLLYQSDRSGTVYNIPAVFILAGELKKEKLAGIFKQLILRHEILRTSFAQVKGEPVQRVHRHVDFEIEYKNSSTDYTDYTDEKENNRLHHSSFMNTPNHFIRAFDLSKAPLLRVGLIKTGEEEHILVFDMHHIISDGASMGILIQEFMALYAGKSLLQPRVQYKDYAHWQSSDAWQESLKAAEVFWSEQFRGTGGLPHLKLPTDFDRPAVRDFAGAIAKFELDDRETAALKRAAKEEGTTLYMLLLALYNVLLARLSGQEDIIVGTPVIGRYLEELQDTIGMFVNTLALRNFPKIESPFKNFLNEVKEHTIDAFKYQDYPFEKLVEKVAPNLDNNRNPLFDVMFTLQNMDIPELRMPGLALKPYPHESVTAKFDLNLIGIEKNKALLFTLEYSTKLFKADTIDRFAGYFKDIIIAILEDRDIKLGDIEMTLELSEAKSALSREADGNFAF